MRARSESSGELRLWELKRRAGEAIEASAGPLGALSHEIWSRPELAYQERQAHAALARFFAARPAWAPRPRYLLDTAFRADAAWPGAGPPGPAAPPALRLAFLCEYDALPGLGHACGHNLIAEVGAAAALGLHAALHSASPRDAPHAPPVQVRIPPHTHTPPQQEGNRARGQGPGAERTAREGALERGAAAAMTGPVSQLGAGHSSARPGSSTGP